MVSTNLRTVWITLRATNYTSQVFGSVMKQCDWLEVKEKRLMTQNLRLGTAALSAGMMFSTMGDQIGGSGGEVLKVTSIFMYMVGVLGYMKAAYLILTGVNWAHSVSVMGVAVSYKMLAVSVAAAFAGFMLMYAISKQLPAPLAILAGAILAVAAAIIILKSVLGDYSVLAGAALGAAAAGSMYAAYSNLTSHQMGTRMIAATGPVIAHRGEILYNPSTGRPTQVQNDLQTGRPSTTIFEMPITIENINTKADIDDLDEKIGKSIRRAANRSK